MSKSNRSTPVYFPALYSEDKRRRALDAISLHRRNPDISLSQAARQSGTTLATIKRYASGALANRGGRTVVRENDNIERRMRFLTARGEIAVTARGSREATKIAEYYNAIRAYFVQGDARALRRYAGKTITLDGQTYEFVAEPRVLNRLARAGEVTFMDIYASDGGYS